MAPKYNRGVHGLHALAPSALSPSSFLTVLHDSTRAECHEWYADKNRGERLSLKVQHQGKSERGGGDGGECAGGGSGEAVRCLWSRQWEIGGVGMETTGWRQPHGH